MGPASPAVLYKALLGPEGHRVVSPHHPQISRRPQEHSRVHTGASAAVPWETPERPQAPPAGARGRVPCSERRPFEGT